MDTLFFPLYWNTLPEKLAVLFLEPFEQCNMWSLVFSTNFSRSRYQIAVICARLDHHYKWSVSGFSEIIHVLKINQVSVAKSTDCERIFIE